MDNLLEWRRVRGEAVLLQLQYFSCHAFEFNVVELENGLFKAVEKAIVDF